MKAKKIIAIGVTTILILAIVFNRFTRLLKGEQNNLLFSQDWRDERYSLTSLLNIAFIALFSFFKRLRFQPRSGSERDLDKHIENCTIFLHASHTMTDSNEKNHRKAA